jgi:hypothetical protein
MWYCDCWLWFTTGLLLGITVVSGSFPATRVPSSKNQTRRFTVMAQVNRVSAGGKAGATDLTVTSYVAPVSPDHLR